MIVMFSPEQRERVRRWLENPNGSLVVSNDVIFESVEDGSVWLRLPNLTAIVKWHDQ